MYYTSAVDLWSLGCIAATLLIGISPFSDTFTCEFDQQLAETCDLTNLHSLGIWQRLSMRPKDFIEKLLLFESSVRLRAREALEHEWFTAKVYNTELKDQYQRSIRYWKPRQPRLPVFETFGGGSLLEPSPLVEPATGDKRKRSSSVPIDPPYRPFARKMNRTLLPERSKGSPLTAEVKDAIDNNWSEQAMQIEHVKRRKLSKDQTGKSGKRRAHSPMAWDTSTTPIQNQHLLLEKQRSAPTILVGCGNGVDGASNDLELLALEEEDTDLPCFDLGGLLESPELVVHVSGTPDVRRLKEAPWVSSIEGRRPLADRSINTSSKIRPASHIVKKLLSTPANTGRRRMANVFDLE